MKTGEKNTVLPEQFKETLAPGSPATIIQQVSRSISLGANVLTTVLCRRILNRILYAGSLIQTHQRRLSIWAILAAIVIVLLLSYFKWRTTERQRVAMIQSEQNERMSRQLHDTILQEFQGIALQVQGVAKRLPADDPLRGKMEEVLDLADEALCNARERARNLFPLTANRSELFDRLARCGGELLKQHPRKFVLEVVGKPRMLNLAIQEEAYGIAGEAIRNAFLYSAASRIEVEITYSATVLSVRVRDDGVGVQTEVGVRKTSDHLMIADLYQRARAIPANLRIWSRLSMGTEVELVIPATSAYLRCGAGVL